MSSRRSPARRRSPSGSPTAAPAAPRRVHGDGGVYYAGAWTDIEDLAASGWACKPAAASGATRQPPPRPLSPGYDADVLIIGAGCIGAAIARELSRTAARVVLLDAAEDVTQGATKGNSGIVHSGYDDAPGSLRAQLCWPGNQLFTQLDKELRFGLQRNGSLVVARAGEEAALEELVKRGAANGVQGLRIIDQAEVWVGVWVWCGGSEDGYWAVMVGVACVLRN